MGPVGAEEPIAEGMTLSGWRLSAGRAGCGRLDAEVLGRPARSLTTERVEKAVRPVNAMVVGLAVTVRANERERRGTGVRSTIDLAA